MHENRSWNDVYLLHAFLMYNPAFEIVFFDYYFRRFHRAEIEAICPKFLHNAAAPFGFAGFHQLALPSPTLLRL